MQREMNLIGTTRPLLSPNSCGSSCSSDCSTLRLLDKEAKTTLQLLPPEENPLYVQQGDYMNLKIASISKIVLLVLILITLSAPLAFSQESENESQAVPANQLPLFDRSEEHTSELQSQSNLVCRLLLEKKKINHTPPELNHDSKDNDDSVVNYLG